MPDKTPATTTALTFYPAYCFHLSPTYTSWARLTVADVHTLKERPGFEGQKIYFYLNHPIKWIRLVGLVVAFDILPTVYILTLDDSSGVNIEVKYDRPSARNPLDHQGNGAGRSDSEYKGLMSDSTWETGGFTATGRKIDLRGVDIGSIIKVKGGISTYHGQRQVTLERVAIVQSTAEEVTSWAETTSFRRDVLEHPWFISPEEETKAKEKVESMDRKRKRLEEKNRRKLKQKASEAGKEVRKREEQKARLHREESARRKKEQEEKEEQQRLEQEKAQEIRVTLRRQRDEQRERALKEFGGGR